MLSRIRQITDILPMNTESTATVKQKSNAHLAPLDQITAHETAEASRLQAEVAAMNTELEKAKADSEKRKEEAVHQAKAKAAKELEELKNTELKATLAQANDKKTATVSSIQKQAATNTPKLLDSLTKDVLSK